MHLAQSYLYTQTPEHTILISHSLSKFLFDKERPKVGELPGARSHKYSHLHQRPANDTSVGELRLITEFAFTVLLSVAELADLFLEYKRMDRVQLKVSNDVE